MFKLNQKQLDTYDIVPACALCEYAHPLSSGDELLCRKNGVVSADFVCRKFRYDLLKRTPARRVVPLSAEPLPSLDDEEEIVEEEINEEVNGETLC